MFTNDQAAPGNAPASSAGDGGSLSIDAAVELYRTQRDSEKPKEDEREQAQDTPEQRAADVAPDAGQPDGADGSDSDDVDVADADDEQQEGQEETPQPERPPIDAPASWAKEGQDAFKKLPRDMQEIIAARERDREAFTNQKAQEAATIRKELTETASWVQTQLSTLLEAGKLAIEADFAGIDWTQLQISDPENFIRIRGMYDQRMQQLNRVAAEKQRLDAAAQQQTQAEVQRYLAEEKEKAVAALTGILGKDADMKAHAGNVQKYLTEYYGYSPKDVAITDHRHLAIVTKAMLYDQGRTAREAAQQKVASAPKVMQPKSPPPQPSGKQAVQKAQSRLEKSGSIDDAIALLRARRGATG